MFLEKKINERENESILHVYNSGFPYLKDIGKGYLNIYAKGQNIFKSTVNN